MRAALWIVLAACGSSATKPIEPPVGSGGSVQGGSGSAPAGSTGSIAKKCLPVVSKDCGCVYTCGVGELRGDAWFVTHSFWKGSELKATVEPWCVDNQCTDAFAAEIVCDGICPRKPADPTCHFDAAGTCVGKPAT